MKKLHALMLAGVMASSLLTVKAFADGDESLSNTARESTMTSEEVGPFTSKHPVASHIVTSPLRVVTSATAGTIGFVGGMFKGIGTGVEDSFDYASDFGPKGDTITDRGAHGALYVPTTAVSSVYFVPKGIAVEGGKTAWDFGSRGYKWWNRI